MTFLWLAPFTGPIAAHDFIQLQLKPTTPPKYA